MSQRKKRTPAPPDEEAGVTQGADVHHPQGEGAADPFQSEAFQLGRIVHGVTDIPEVRAYALRIGARLRSMRKLAVEEKRGQYGNHTLAVIKFATNHEGGCTIEADNEDYAPTGDEREAINAAWGRYEWPKYEPKRHVGAHPPRNDPQVPWSFADPDLLAICRDPTGELILCVEVRRPREDGRKDIHIWTHWSDGVWRIAEPPDSLPLYGLERIKGASTIYLHEGPKAAKAVQRLIDDDGDTGWRSHPWGVELRGVMPGAVAHLAWLGGAERPLSTDYGPLTASGAKIIAVADNDQQGKDATGPISEKTKVPMKALFFSNEWPSGFDLADPFPKDMLRKRGERTVYVGPRMADCLRPATWATDKIAVARGRPSYRPRREFVSEWTRSNTPLLYFHRDRPSRGYTEAEFNKMIRAYSHAEDTARLLDQRPSATADGITYAPGKKQGVITENGRQVIQTWQPAAIKPCSGSVMPWLRFATYLIPNRAERFQSLRWTATLIARPDIRMKWGIIARSETQGVGKSTWADILAAQVGFDNVSMPSEQTIAEGKFNSFLARVRLVICNEFYSGHSFRTYNKMKTWITDHTVEVEIKYLPSHTVPAFAHFFLCSNELVPILIDQKDRRFFIPTLTERKLGRAYWRKFYEWLAMDGHGIIRRWAEQFVAKHGPVEIEEEAPPSDAKTAMIEKGQSDEMRLIRDLAEHWVELGRADPPKRILFALDDFRTWLWRQDCGGRKRLSGTVVQKAMRNAGLHVWGRDDGGADRRVKLDGRNGRKMIVITNFVPGPTEDWPTLGEGRLTDFGEPM